MRSHAHDRSRPFLAISAILLACLMSGCTRNVNVRNASPKDASVIITIPEASGEQNYRVPSKDSASGELGDSGTYSVSVMSDADLVGVLTKVRDDLEAQLQAKPLSAAQVNDLADKLRSAQKLRDLVAKRSASCGGHVTDQGDAYVTIGWDDARQNFTATCFSKAADDTSPPPSGANPSTTSGSSATSGSGAPAPPDSGAPPAQPSN